MLNSKDMDFAALADQLKDRLTAHKNELTGLVAKTIKAAKDRNEAISLLSYVLNPDNAISNPLEYNSKKEQLNEILSRHGITGIIV